MNGLPDQRAREMASRRHNVITRREAIQAGLSDRMIQTRVRCGLWTRLATGVYQLGGGPRHAHLAAAVASLPQAIVSHQSAGRLHLLEYVPNIPLAVTVAARTTHVFPGVVVHRTDDLAPEHVTEVDDLPVTTVARTIIDLAAVLHPAHLEQVLEEGLVARRCAIDDIHEHLGLIARRGKPGVAALRELLLTRDGREVVPHSRLERLALQVFGSAGLPNPVCQYPAPWNPDERVDLALPEARLIIELDGRRWHGRQRDFENDRRRDNAAVSAGWRVLRFTWARLREEPGAVCAEVRRALAAPDEPRVPARLSGA
ncbi:MAG: DUF559 domain-containing protein [Acidimicrobiia bacterium]